MRRSLPEELRELTAYLDEEFKLIVEMFEDASKLVENYSPDIYDGIIQAEERVNRMEVELEVRCIELLALYQPEARDLRSIVTVIKVNNDLERIADHVENIARDINLIHENDGRIVVLPDKLLSLVEERLKLSRKALLEGNTSLAEELMGRDAEVDSERDALVEDIVGIIMISPRQAPFALKTLNVVQNLERIADLTTNICEYVIFLQKGIIKRHGFER